LTINGSVNLSLNLGYDPVDFVDTFTILLNDGTDAIAGAAPGKFTVDGTVLNESDLFTVGSQTFRISYGAGDGNDAVLFAVPEPCTAVFIGSSLFILVLQRRRNTGSLKSVEVHL
jgi:hypothetical protein